MSGEPLVFVDTNVLVYARDLSEPVKQPVALAWIERLWRTGRGRLSAQVLHEFYVTVTRRLDPGMPADQARADVQDLRSWRPVPLTLGLTEEAWQIEDRHAVSFWDALIVAAAGRAGCRYLLTEDLQDGQKLVGLEVVDPFIRSQQKILGVG